MTEERDLATEDDFEFTPTPLDESELVGEADVVADEAVVTADDADEVGPAGATSAEVGSAESGAGDSGDEMELEGAEIAAVVPQRDPLSRLLLGVALSLIVILLVTTGLIFYYMQTLNKAPRTAIERDITAGEAAVKEYPQEPNTWAALAIAYAEAGRFDDAYATIDRAEKLTKTSALTIIRAEVLRRQGRYEAALKTYDEAEKIIRSGLKQAGTRRAQKGIFFDPDDPTLIEVYMGRGVCYDELGEVKKAIVQLQKAAELAPDQTTILVQLAGYYAEDGQTAKAEAAYEKALTFVPDDPDALAGLKKLKEGVK